MPIIGLAFGLIFVHVDMPLFGNRLIHCVFLGIVFGFINYFTAVGIYKKYNVLKKCNIQLTKDLQVDELTGLFNRRIFDNDIQELSLGDTYSIIFLDIDNFRKFNNEFGHQTGDTVLKKVSQTIKSTVRANDRVYRYGGEEIVILLKDCGKKTAFEIAEKIRLNISTIHNSHIPPITVSLGLSSYPDGGTEIVKIIKASDNALLTAKKLGKNQVFVNAK